MSSLSSPEIQAGRPEDYGTVWNRVDETDRRDEHGDGVPGGDAAGSRADRDPPDSAAHPDIVRRGPSAARGAYLRRWPAPAIHSGVLEAAGSTGGSGNVLPPRRLSRSMASAQS